MNSEDERIMKQIGVNHSDKGPVDDANGTIRSTVTSQSAVSSPKQSIHINTLGYVLKVSFNILSGSLCKRYQEEQI